MANSSTLTPTDRYNILTSSGFSQLDAEVMTAISYYECGGCDMSTPVRNSNGTYDVGLFQINSSHWGSSTPQTSKYGDLTNPVNNARAALDIFNAGGFKQWCTYPGGCNLTPGTQGQPTTAEFGATLAWVVAAIEQGGTQPAPPGSSPQIPPSQTSPDGTGSPASQFKGLQLGIVVIAGVFFIVIGAIIWKGSTAVNVVEKAAPLAGNSGDSSGSSSSPGGNGKLLRETHGKLHRIS